MISMSIYHGYIIYMYIGPGGELNLDEQNSSEGSDEEDDYT